MVMPPESKIFKPPPPLCDTRHRLNARKGKGVRIYALTIARHLVGR